MEVDIDTANQCSQCFLWIFLYKLFPTTFSGAKNIYSCILLIREIWLPTFILDMAIELAGRKVHHYDRTKEFSRGNGAGL